MGMTRALLPRAHTVATMVEAGIGSTTTKTFHSKGKALRTNYAYCVCGTDIDVHACTMSFIRLRFSTSF